MTAKLNALVKEIEAQNVSFKGWATPGATVNSAALDVARTVCRRAERRVYDLQAAGDLKNVEVLIFLNRLSDLLWLFARWAETQPNRRKNEAALTATRPQASRKILLVSSCSQFSSFQLQPLPQRNLF